MPVPRPRVEPLPPNPPYFGEKPSGFNGYPRHTDQHGRGQGEIEGRGKKITKSIDRITRIDIARALCVIGMVLAHFTSTLPSINLLMAVVATVNGRASLAFVFVAGIGVTLLDQAKGPRESAFALLWRAWILVLMGISLQVVSPGPILILQFYAVYYIVGWVGARLPTWVLVVLIPSWLVGGSWLWWLHAPRLAIGDLTTPPLTQAWIILYSGQYPVVTWGSVMLLGVMIGRIDWHQRRQVAAVGGGAVLVLGLVHLVLFVQTQRLGLSSPSQLPEWLVLEPHSNTIPYLVDGAASAMILVCACVLASPYLGKVGAWLAVIGRQALTLYVVHIFWFYLFTIGLDALYWNSPIADSLVTEAQLAWWDRIFVVMAYVAAMVCIGLLAIQAVVWDRTIGLGPLERLLRRPKRHSA